LVITLSWLSLSLGAGSQLVITLSWLSLSLGAGSQLVIVLSEKIIKEKKKKNGKKTNKNTPEYYNFIIQKRPGVLENLEMLRNLNKLIFENGYIFTPKTI
jgi:hypothetical protein